MTSAIKAIRTYDKKGNAHVAITVGDEQVGTFGGKRAELPYAIVTKFSWKYGWGHYGFRSDFAKAQAEAQRITTFVQNEGAYVVEVTEA